MTLPLRPPATAAGDTGDTAEQREAERGPDPVAGGVDPTAPAPFDYWAGAVAVPDPTKPDGAGATTPPAPSAVPADTAAPADPVAASAGQMTVALPRAEELLAMSEGELDAASSVLDTAADTLAAAREQVCLERLRRRVVGDRADAAGVRLRGHDAAGLCEWQLFEILDKDGDSLAVARADLVRLDDACYAELRELTFAAPPVSRADRRTIRFRSPAR